MRILPIAFNLLTFCGCWRSTTWSTTTCRRAIYTIYTIFILLIIHSFALSQLMDMILTVDNIEDFTDNSYMLLAMMISCCKMISLVMNKRRIESLTNMPVEEPFQTVNKEEMMIRQKFERIIRAYSLNYATLLETTALSITVTSYFMDFKKRRLTFRAWLPFDYSSPLVFSLAFLHQSIGLAAGALLHAATDSLICGLLMQTCCQFEILECRLKRITNDRFDDLRKCARYHDRLYKFATIINETFRTVIFIQFLVSTLVICFNLCQLVKVKSLNARLVQMILYMSCILMQIFLYCWCGNEVKLKSLKLSSTIFQLDWPVLNNDAKRCLMMMMRRATYPIEFASAYIITLNLDSFVGLLKTSYSAYNLFQRTQKT